MEIESMYFIETLEQTQEIKRRVLK